MKLSTVMGLVVGAVALYSAYVGVLYFAQRSMLFPRPMSEPGESPNDGHEVIWLSTNSGKVECWYYPPATHLPSAATPDNGSPAVILAHGNAEVIDTFSGEFDGFRELGMAVLLVEYPGYGRSEGSPSQHSITEALIIAYDRLVARDEIDEDRVVLFGRSLGGGAVCALAAQRPAAALVLLSTFTSIREMAYRYLAPKFLVRDPFDNLAVVERFAGPVLVVHGTDDGLIPIAQAETLHRAAERGQMLRYPCGHGDCPPDWDRFWRDMAHFLRTNDLVAG